MKTIVFIALIILVFLESCLPVAKLSMGITRPKEETPEGLFAYLEEKHYPLQDLFILKDSATYADLWEDSAFQKCLCRTNFFLGDFRRIEPDTARCQWSGGYTVARLKKDSTYSVVSDSLSFHYFKAMMVPLFDTMPPLIAAPGQYDFILVNTWAKFIGKMNERLFAANEAVRERDDLKILVINLNMDMQKSWNLRKDQKLHLE